MDKEKNKADIIAKQAAKEALMEALLEVEKSSSVEEAHKKIEEMIRRK